MFNRCNGRGGQVPKDRACRQIETDCGAVAGRAAKFIGSGL
jgi:hypothetical protein